jgi:hypothetical protein
LSPRRRRSLKDAARDPLATGTKPLQSDPAPPPKKARSGPPVVVKVAIGLLIGLAGGFVLGRFNRWI